MLCVHLVGKQTALLFFYFFSFGTDAIFYSDYFAPVDFLITLMVVAIAVNNV